MLAEIKAAILLYKQFVLNKPLPQPEIIWEFNDQIIHSFKNIGDNIVIEKLYKYNKIKFAKQIGFYQKLLDDAGNDPVLQYDPANMLQEFKRKAEELEHRHSSVMSVYDIINTHTE